MNFGGMDEGHDDGETPMHFYYNREERLKSAPQNVRDYYEGKAPHIEKNVFKALTSSPVNRVGLVTVLVAAAVIFIVSMTAEKPYKKNVGGTEMTLLASSYEDSVYVSLKAAANTKKNGSGVKAGSVIVKFTAVDNQGEETVQTEKSEGYTGKELILRTKFDDYDIVSVRADVVFNNTEKELSAAVEKR